MRRKRPPHRSSCERAGNRGTHRQREDYGVGRRANAILLLDDGKTALRSQSFSNWTTTPSVADISIVDILRLVMAGSRDRRSGSGLTTTPSARAIVQYGFVNFSVVIDAILVK